MKRIVVLVAALSIQIAPACADPAPPAITAAADSGISRAHKTPEQFLYLNPADFDPDRLLAAPPARGSQIEAVELARLHALMGSASKQRMDQAKWDDEHEDPSIFDAAIGRDLSKLPKTWALLTAIQHETDIAIGISKEHFARTRPWGVDAALNMCGADTAKPAARSYPSGHAGLGWAVGFALAQLLPDRAIAVLSRAEDYALSRELCGAHFRTDTEASRVIGTLVASRLLADRRLTAQIAAAQAELSPP